MRTSLAETAQDIADSKGSVLGYAIVVAMDDGSVIRAWDTGGERLRLLGALDVIRDRILRELNSE